MFTANWKSFYYFLVSPKHSIRKRPTRSTLWSFCVLFLFRLPSSTRPTQRSFLYWVLFQHWLVGFGFSMSGPSKSFFFFFCRFPKYYFLQTFLTVVVCFSYAFLTRRLRFKHLLVQTYFRNIFLLSRYQTFISIRFPRRPGTFQYIITAGRVRHYNRFITRQLLFSV